MVEVITANTGTLAASFAAVGGAAIAISAATFGLRKGWAYFRGLMKG
jgi:hypothetical protein